MPYRKTQRPETARTTRDGMKLHLRLIGVGRQTYRVITLRPGTDAAFSTNFHHDTWHVLSDAAGARWLGRLMWGLSYQRQPGTLVLIHGEHLRPTPFDADPSDPILLLPDTLTPRDPGAFRVLKDRLCRLPAPVTVRWRTFGLDQAAGPRAEGAGEQAPALQWPEWRHPVWRRERTTRCGGFVCYAAAPVVMRFEALRVYGLDPSRRGMDYQYLAEGRRGWPPEGEVQVFRDYRRQLSRAATARREVLAETHGLHSPQQLREAVWERCAQVRRRRRGAEDLSGTG